MIDRYSLPEMAEVWSEERKLALWQEIEGAALEGWAGLGLVPAAVAAAVRSAPPVDAARWRERERVTNHDVAAFVDLLAAAVPGAERWVHFGLTSSDVLDTALAVQLRDSTTILLARIGDLFEVTKRRALEHRGSLMMGRTHGVWAEPITFGLKLAGWCFELQRDHDRLAAVRRRVAIGKLSGAVGSYAHVAPEVEAHVCAGLGLEVEPAATQVTGRDRHAEYLSTLALVGSTLERIATEIRHLQRSEVAEVREPFATDQKGSSAMPHKRNPIVAENTTGIARLLRGYAQAGLEDVALWHERDISHSVVERVAIPDASLLLHYALSRMTRLVDELVVDTERMTTNLASARGLVFSEGALLALIEEGLSRDAAYRIVQRNALRVWDEGGDLLDALAADPEVPLAGDRLRSIFDLQRTVESIAPVFDRLNEVEL